MLTASPDLALKYDYSTPLFKKCIEWLKEHDACAMEAGRYEISDGAYASIQKYTTRPVEQCLFEAHDAYFDIQYIAKGVESFGTCPREGLELTEERKADDLFFFKTPKYFSVNVLTAGQLCIVPPEEAHRPCEAWNGEPAEVVKVVIKVPVR